mmetsp:Transcript_23974/g.36941  ORF Transcript_23974/g.36941 Transcript_23974/m.36941 type:complete len:106 (+) Transcript_23974:1749-2066(+)
MLNISGSILNTEYTSLVTSAKNNENAKSLTNGAIWLFAALQYFVTARLTQSKKTTANILRLFVLEKKDPPSNTKRSSTKTAKTPVQTASVMKLVDSDNMGSPKSG